MVKVNGWGQEVWDGSDGVDLFQAIGIAMRDWPDRFPEICGEALQEIRDRDLSLRAYHHNITLLRGNWYKLHPRRQEGR